MTKDEEKAILAALEEDYPTGRAAAAAVFKVVKGLLAQRNAHAVGVNVGSDEQPFFLPFGPFWDANEVKAFRKLLPSFTTRTATLYGPATVGSGDYTSLCGRCGHPWLPHTYGTECIVPGCSCKSVRTKGGWKHAEEDDEADAAEGAAA